MIDIFMDNWASIQWQEMKLWREKPFRKEQQTKQISSPR